MDTSFSKSIFLTWKDLSVKVPVGGSHGQSRYLLQNVSGYADSGCGKTTLLTALAGRLGTAVVDSGEILTNGQRQQLSYGNSISGHLLLTEILIALALLRHCFSHAILQCNELDAKAFAIPLSAAAFHVVKRLQLLAKSGRTLLISIHQPSSEHKRGTCRVIQVSLDILLMKTKACAFHVCARQKTTNWARGGLFIFVTAFLTFMGVVSFPSFIEDMKIFMRERLNEHYGVAVFVMANFLSAFPFVLLLAIIRGTILYTMTSLHPGFDHFICFLVTFLATLSVEEGLLMAVANVAPDFLTGMIAGCGIMGMYLLNGGFFQLLRKLPKPVWQYPLSYMSFHTWATRAFYNNDF
ncbi:hypothetical protein GOP47_0014460 [Adiantum capillus-veneris]|uniref:ABC-2 type transporter transmembrane domain-containing protein n=1 Tax=Adiantum capillus-veneris TaxID=13818 RepID=A0A9D4ZDI7_ADICA|nr:hypothetical protein GOP47_0014460 [Adiantum capillus-veneris]